MKTQNSKLKTQNFDDRPVGIFDSGVGGLSILSSVKKLLPNESIIYVADQKNNPYGGRSVDEINRISEKVVKFLLDKKVKIVIIACNTVSVNAIDYLREKFNIPIIAVVPVIKTISKATKTGKTAVFSTPATAKSKYLQDLIDKFAADTDVTVVGTSKLEHLVEEGKIEGREVEEAIRASITPLTNKNIDSIALGCTHYPFLRKELQKALGSKVAIYDSGGAVARRVKFILEKEEMSADVNEDKKTEIYYTSGDVAKFRQVAEMLLATKLVNVKHADL